MNRHFFGSLVFIFVALSLAVSKSYACSTAPTARIADYTERVCVGCAAEFDGLGSCVPPTGSYDYDNESPYGCGHGISKYEWDFGDESDPCTAATPSHTYTTADTYTVELKVTDDDDPNQSDTITCTVYVVKVDKVVKSGTTDEGPLYTYLEGAAYLEAKPYPAVSFPTGEPHWTVESQPSGANASLTPSSGSATTTLGNLTKPGHYIVNAKCGSSDTGDSITVIVVEPNLNIEDVPDDDEEDPGGYVSFNNDDDNDNGTPDKDDETVTVDGEDNLVEISLSVSPSLSTGEVELRLDDYPYLPNVRVWSSPTMGEGNMIIPDDANYYKEWPVQSMPATLYVEGISPSWPRADTLWLSYKRDGATITWDTVKFTVVEVELFRDSSYSQVLDDWPKDGDQLRSPKYIFGEDDPIYVEVDNLGRDDQTAESFSDLVWVTSESDTSDTVRLKLQETGPSTQVFNNSEPLGELLYLSTSSSEGDGDKIEVIDEEKLTFWLEIQPDSDNYVTCKTVMVDRGEFLAVAGSEMLPALNIPWFNAAIFEEDCMLTVGWGDGQTYFLEGYQWWENGYMEGKAYSGDDPDPVGLAYEQSKNTAFNAGAKDPKSCADSLSLTCHGGMGIMVIVSGESTEVTWDPEVDIGSTGWSNDAEIIILHGCESIAWREGGGGFPPAAPEGRIEDLWVGNVSTGVRGDELFSTGIHAVLGYCADVSTLALWTDVRKFWEYCHGGSTVANAWKQACLSGLNAPYAVVVRESNLNDYIAPLWKGPQQLTRDSTELADTTTFLYYSYDIGTKIYEPAGAGAAYSISSRYKDIKAEIDKQIEFKGTYEVDKLAITGQAEHIRLNTQQEVAHNFDSTSSTEFDFLATRRFDKLDSDKHAIEVTLDGLKQWLASVGLSIPPQYVFESKGKMMARRFGKGEGSGETWCEGDVFRFTRQFDGKTIFSDTCTVAIRNADVILYSLRNHPVKKVGTQTAKEFTFKTREGGIDPRQVDTKLVYEVKGKTIVPVWHVKYGDYLFKYDAVSGDTYRDR